ncbi:MAG: cph2 5 [Paenibacillaceae bacterium]|jgi:diguanylate cyclase (GGDEF)-like protein/PAS domain S-box-containing protein|nr:cph2 5 [Paenibacillaceae bacterium]
MIQPFISNASILLLCVFGYYLLNLRAQRDAPGRQAEGGGQVRSLTTGFLFGAAGVLLVVSSVLLEGGVRLDLRNVDILIAALLGGPYAALIATGFIAAARLAQGGIYLASVVGVSSALATALASIILVRRLPVCRLSTWMIGYIIQYLFIVATYAIVLPSDSLLFRYMMYYIVVSLPVIGLCYMLHSQLVRVNELYAEAQYNGEKYRQLFYSAHDLVYLFTVEDGQPRRILDANTAAAQALGYERDELLALSPKDMYDPAFLALERDTEDSCLLKGQQRMFEWSLTRKDGSIILVEISGRILRLSGQLVCLAVARDISLRKESERALMEANQKLERLSVSDGLTGIYNRRGMDLYYRMFWDRALESGAPLAVLLLDIDYFKAYNDTYGHLAGDHCLKRIAVALESQAAVAGGIACRYGGEEFAVVLPETDGMKALQVASTIREAVSGLALLHAGSAVSGCVTLSIGIAVHAPQEEDPVREDLLERADQALYIAKHGGRNRAAMWEKGLGGEAAEDLITRSQVAAAEDLIG